MDWLTGQFAVLGQGPDGEESGWMQLLVFIVLAVFWAIGGIMKARAAAKAQAEKNKQPKGPAPQAPARPRPSFERIFEAQPEKARARPKEAQAAKMAQQLSQAKAAKPVPKAPVAAEAAKGVVPQQMGEAKPVVEAPAEVTALAAVEGLGLEIGSSEQLRAAILHYEIFGKCVGVREPQEQAWMR